MILTQGKLLTRLKTEVDNRHQYDCNVGEVVINRIYFQL